MIDPKIFDDVAKKFAESIPSSVKEMGKDIEKNAHALLQSAFGKLDLVTRDEFDTQVGVLTRTRLKLEAVEKKLAELEEQLLKADSTKKSKQKHAKE
jgi:ubiquinone biosynthesis accessory factor UbiK